MKFETAQIHFLIEVSVCCCPEIFLPWQCDETTSPLYTVVYIILLFCTVTLCSFLLLFSFKVAEGRARGAGNQGKSPAPRPPAPSPLLVTAMFVSA